jgi:zinc D-Ala-D-Ala carboxypeptidase
MQLSRHFSLAELTVSETAARLGLNNQPASRQHMDNLRALAAVLEQVRAIWRRPVQIISAYRSPAVNRAVGGVATSDHAVGLAADIRVQGIEGRAVADAVAASAIGFDQLIWYRISGSVHIGIGARMRRQVRTNPTTRAGAQLLVGIVP